MDVLWNVLRTMKPQIDFGGNYVCDYVNKILYKSNDADVGIGAIVAAVESRLKIESSDQIHENMSIEHLEIAARMFIYINTCPDPLMPWFIFYQDLFRNEPLDTILLSLNRLMIGRDSKEENNMKTIARNLFEKIGTKFPLKYQKMGGSKMKCMLDI